jgi:hypothetical protein
MACEVGHDQLSDCLRGQLHLLMISMCRQKGCLIKTILLDFVHRPTFLKATIFHKSGAHKVYCVFSLREDILNPYFFSSSEVGNRISFRNVVVIASWSDGQSHQCVASSSKALKRRSM